MVAARACFAENEQSSILALSRICLKALLQVAAPGREFVSDTRSFGVVCVVDLNLGELAIQPLQQSSHLNTAICNTTQLQQVHLSEPTKSSINNFMRESDFISTTIFALQSQRYSSTWTCNVSGGCFNPSLPFVSGSGYTAQPTAVQSCLQLLSAAKFACAQARGNICAASSIGGFTSLGHLCKSEGYILASEDSSMSTEVSMPANYVIQYRHAQSVVGCLEAVESHVLMGSSAYKSATNQLNVLYSGEWQAAPSFDTMVILSETRLSVDASNKGHQAWQSSMVAVLQYVSSIKYSTSQDDTGDSASTHTARLLEVVQCSSSFGIVDFLLQSSGGMHVNMSPIANAPYSVAESSAQGLMRTVAAEFPLITVRSSDSSHEGLPAI